MDLDCQVIQNTQHTGQRLDVLHATELVVAGVESWRRRVGVRGLRIMRIMAITRQLTNELGEALHASQPRQGIVAQIQPGQSLEVVCTDGKDGEVRGEIQPLPVCFSSCQTLPNALVLVRLLLDRSRRNSCLSWLIRGNGTSTVSRNRLKSR